MKYVLYALLAVIAAPVHAEDMTVSVGGVSQTWTLTADDQVKFEQWVQNAYRCTGKPDCTPISLAESETKWATATLQGTIDNVNNYHRFLAGSKAVAEVPPVNPQVGGTKKK